MNDEILKSVTELYRENLATPPHTVNDIDIAYHDLMYRLGLIVNTYTLEPEDTPYHELQRPVTKRRPEYPRNRPSIAYTTSQRVTGYAA